MEFAEYLFKKYRSWKSERDSKSINPSTVKLSEVKHRLTLLACALTGDPIEILTAENIGGWKGHYFYLPAKMDRYDSLDLNFHFYIFRVIYLTKQKQLNLNWTVEKPNDIASEQKALDTSHVVLKALSDEYDGFHALYKKVESLEDKRFLYGRWMLNDQIQTPETLEHISQDVKKNDDQRDEITTEIEANPVEEIISIQVDKEKQEEYMLTHNFEKLETAESFDDIWRDFDGDDSLEDDLEALNDIGLKHTVRVDDVVHSVYKSEFTGNLTIAQSKELKENGFYYEYPEWDHTHGKYFEGHCKVYPLLFRSKNKSFAENVLREKKHLSIKMKKMLASFFNKRAAVKRVTDGDHFDLDEVIDYYCDIHTQHTPDERIYVSKRKRQKEISILFLLDLSLSGDGYMANRRIIDVEREAVILLGDVFSSFEIEFQVDGFFSKTRNFCNYITLKHFDDSWNRGMANISGISPMGFTRIGPAIRHANFLLSKRSSRKKWLILLSDGKPNDYDRYGGKYGVLDIRKAISELEVNRIGSYALAIEKQAKYYLPQMFGINHYSIITDPEALPEAIINLYQRLAN